MILNIETSTSVCSVSIQLEDQLLGSIALHLEKSHSSVLPVIIGQLLDQVGVAKAELLAVGISEGPGSYTGLRIGASTAKGLAFALGIPLIAVNALDSMINQVPTGLLNNEDVLMPMMDARRMEVYMKAVSSSKKKIMPLQALVLEANSFDHILNRRLVLFGNGAEKAVDCLIYPNKVLVKNVMPSAVGMVTDVYDKYVAGNFEDVAYFEPLYLKEFQTKKSKDLLRP